MNENSKINTKIDRWKCDGGVVVTVSGGGGVEKADGFVLSPCHVLKGKVHGSPNKVLFYYYPFHPSAIDFLSLSLSVPLIYRSNVHLWFN